MKRVIDKRRRAKLEAFEHELGYRFNRPELLDRAFIHRSYLNECADKTLVSNERLEFLGDAVLELVVSDFLYRRYPDEPEGDLTRRRTQIVCEASFAYIAERLGVGLLLLLGKGEDSTGGRRKASLLSDCFEAICGAIYLDGGYEWLYEYFQKNIESFILAEADQKRIFIDYKTKLQECLFREERAFTYEVLEESGPSHDKRFTVGLLIDGVVAATAQARSKKMAEQLAAKNALEGLKDDTKPGKKH